MSENLSVNTEAIIQRHLQKGFTKEDALTFIKKVKSLVSSGNLTVQEAQALLDTSTTDCKG